MKIDTFISLINDIRKGQLTNDTDPNNTVIQMYTSPYDAVSSSDSVRGYVWPKTACVWGDGTTYVQYDNNGDPWYAPSCGWMYNANGRWS